MNRNFNEIYQKICSNGVEELTELRKKSNFALIMLIVLIVLGAIVFVTAKEANALCIICPLGAIVALVNYIVSNSKYKKAFKSAVMEKLVSYYDENLRFQANSGVSRADYNAGGFSDNYDHFYSEDLITGTINNELILKMSQVKTTRQETRTDSEGHTTTETVTVFYGLYGMVDIGNSRIPEFSITSNNVLNRFSKSRIEMDSSEFEKNFDIFGIDKVRIMEIFTSDLIEQFNKFTNNSKDAIQIKTTPRTLFFRIHCGEAFEAPKMKSAIDFDTLYKYFYMIDGPIGITLKLIENSKSTDL